MFAGDKISEGRKLLRAQFDGKSSLFYVELPGGTILSHSVEENEKFPVQFGREVRYLASLNRYAFTLIRIIIESCLRKSRIINKKPGIQAFE